MKLLMQAMVGTVFFALLTGISLAQSPHEQLQQLTMQLQQMPSDNALRERIIKLGAEIKPTPAVPEEARRSFVEGVNIVKLAKDAGSQKLAIESFTEASKIAPWWGDAYYNLAVAQELTGQLNDAERTLKWFLLTNPGESHAREAQDRIYGLSAKRKLAIAEAEAKQEQTDREMAAQARRFEGDWFRTVKNAIGEISSESISIRRDSYNAWHIYDIYEGRLAERRGVRESEVTGSELRFKEDGYMHGSLCSTDAVRGTVSANGRLLTLAYTLMPFSPDRSFKHCLPAENYSLSSFQSYQKLKP